MPSVIGEAFIAIRPETAGFATSLKSEVSGASNAAAGNMTSVFNTATTRVGRTFSGLGGVLSSQFGLPFAGVLDMLGVKLQGLEAKGEGLGSVFASVAGPAAVAGIAVVGAVVAESLHLADAFEGANARLRGAVHNVGQSWGDFSDAVDHVNKKLENLGFTNTETEGSLATLVRASGSTEKAISLMGLAADIARARNISLESATSILAKVQTGHVALLGRYGIATKNAAGDTLSVEEAVKALSDKFGGQAKTSAETFTGKMGVLGTKLEDIGTRIGVALIPFVEKLTDALTVAVDWVNAHQHDFERFFDDAATAVQTAWAAIKPIYSAIWQQLEAVFNLVDDLIHGRWNQIFGDLVNIVEAAFGALAAPFVGLYNLFSGTFDDIGNVVSAAADRMVIALQPIIDTLLWIWRRIQDIKDAWNSLPGRSGTGQGGSGPIDFTGLAGGGPVGPGTFLVGERGNGGELLTLGPGSSGYVTNAKQTDAMMGGRGDRYDITIYDKTANATERAIAMVQRQRVARALANL